MCRNGLYTECGIKERDGFCTQRYRIEPEYAVRVDPALEQVGMLLEPASVLAKAWEHVERIGTRPLAAATRTRDRRRGCENGDRFRNVDQTEVPCPNHLKITA